MKDWNQIEEELCTDGALISINALTGGVPPLSVWNDLESPLTVDEILAYAKTNDGELAQTPNYYQIPSFTPEEFRNARENHIKKIVFFMKNEMTTPIDIEIMEEASITDGHHRLCGKMLAGEKAILGTAGGFLDDGIGLGLFVELETAQ